MKNIFKNWKTTSAGILTAVGGVVLYVNDNTRITEALLTILTGLGLILAKDGDQTGVAQ
jgi:uncharacterized membrane protein HdeD (DUF308 family)